MKNKIEIKSIASHIASQEGQYIFSASEISKILGVCKDTTREICKNLEPAEFGRIKTVSYTHLALDLEKVAHMINC